jgi:hypothetical protein
VHAAAMHARACQMPCHAHAVLFPLLAQLEAHRPAPPELASETFCFSLIIAMRISRHSGCG